MRRRGSQTGQAPPQHGPLRRIEFRQIDAVDEHAPFRRQVEPAGEIEQRRFSRARWPHDGNEFSGMQGEIRMLQRHHLADTRFMDS